MTLSDAVKRLRRMARSASLEDAEALRFAADSLSHSMQPELPGLPAFQGINPTGKAPIRGQSREDEPWTDADDSRLKELRQMGHTRREIAHVLGRTPKAVERREDRITPKPEQMALIASAAKSAINEEEHAHAA